MKVYLKQYEIEKIARCSLPAFFACYESEEGRREFAEQKAQREQGQTQDIST